jgi:hypothetical protein
MRTAIMGAIALSMATSMTAFAGGTEGHGGNGIKVQFKADGLRILELLKDFRGKRYFPAVDPEKFLSLLDSTLIVLAEHAYLPNGAERDAVNYPKTGKIVLGRVRTAKLTDAELLSLSFHEYLCIYGLEKEDDYSTSSRLTAVLEKPVWECSMTCGIFLGDTHLPADYGSTTYSCEHSHNNSFAWKNVSLRGESPSDAVDSNSVPVDPSSGPLHGRGLNYCSGTNTFLLTDIICDDRGVPVISPYLDTQRTCHKVN